LKGGTRDLLERRGEIGNQLSTGGEGWSFLEKWDRFGKRRQRVFVLTANKSRREKPSLPGGKGKGGKKKLG